MCGHAEVILNRTCCSAGSGSPQEEGALGGASGNLTGTDRKRGGAVASSGSQRAEQAEQEAREAAKACQDCLPTISSLGPMRGCPAQDSQWGRLLRHRPWPHWGKATRCGQEATKGAAGAPDLRVGDSNMGDLRCHLPQQETEDQKAAPTHRVPPVGGHLSAHLV